MAPAAPAAREAGALRGLPCRGPCSRGPGAARPGRPGPQLARRPGASCPSGLHAAPAPAHHPQPRVRVAQAMRGGSFLFELQVTFRSDTRALAGAGSSRPGRGSGRGPDPEGHKAACGPRPEGADPCLPRPRARPAVVSTTSGRTHPRLVSLSFALCRADQPARSSQCHEDGTHFLPSSAEASPRLKGHVWLLTPGGPRGHDGSEAVSAGLGTGIDFSPAPVWELMASGASRAW